MWARRFYIPISSWVQMQHMYIVLIADMGFVLNLARCSSEGDLTVCSTNPSI